MSKKNKTNNAPIQTPVKAQPDELKIGPWTYTEERVLISSITLNPLNPRSDAAKRPKILANFKTNGWNPVYDPALGRHRIPVLHPTVDGKGLEPVQGNGRVASAQAWLAEHNKSTDVKFLETFPDCKIPCLIANRRFTDTEQTVWFSDFDPSAERLDRLGRFLQFMAFKAAGLPDLEACLRAGETNRNVIFTSLYALDESTRQAWIEGEKAKDQKLGQTVLKDAAALAREHAENHPLDGGIGEAAQEIIETALAGDKEIRAKVMAQDAILTFARQLVPLKGTTKIVDALLIVAGLSLDANGKKSYLTDTERTKAQSEFVSDLC